MFLLGARYYVWRVPYKTILLSSLHEKVRGEQAGTIKVIDNITALIAPVVSGVVISVGGVRVIFVIASLLYLFGAVFSARFFK